MATGACPTCGGTERRVLSPGYYECLSQELKDVAPRGAVAEYEVPIYGTCGRRYQEQPTTGSDPSRVCYCGMFAVGVCQECGELICGVHGELVGAQFVCRAHGDERRAAAAARWREDYERERKEKEEQTARILSARESIAPGFPEDGESTGAAIAEALKRLVPDQTRPFVVARRSRRRVEAVEAWGFRTDVKNTREREYLWKGSIFRPDGHWYATDEWGGVDWQPPREPPPWEKERHLLSPTGPVDAQAVAWIRDQVLGMLGAPDDDIARAEPPLLPTVYGGWDSGYVPPRSAP